MNSVKSKTCKAVPQEDCGVWLDAAELRAKKRRKLIKPISKLLNPLAQSRRYSVAVTLNFTQTKMKMPATKQSRISTFFAPQSKNGRDAEDCSSSGPSEMSSTPLPGACFGTKRKREMIFKLPFETDDVSGPSSPIELQENNADIAGVSGERCKEDNDYDKEQQFLQLIWGGQSEECEPARKKTCVNIQTETVTETQPDNNKAIKNDCECEEIPETLFHSSQTQQYSQKNFRMRETISGKTCDGSSASQEPVKDQSFTKKRFSFLTRRSATEIQNMTNCLKSYKEPELTKQRRQWPPVRTEDKENKKPTSPRPNVALSTLKQHVYSSPAKCALDLNKKLCQTPSKSIEEAQESDEDSCGMLFTQDSEGFRVIAHRSKQSRCPLKDRTNSHEDREYSSSPSVMPLNLEESSDPDPEMLFTQDSQGNIVIKH